MSRVRRRGVPAAGEARTAPRACVAQRRAEVGGPMGCFEPRYPERGSSPGLLHARESACPQRVMARLHARHRALHPPSAHPPAAVASCDILLARTARRCSIPAPRRRPLRCASALRCSCACVRACADARAARVCGPRVGQKKDPTCESAAAPHRAARRRHPRPRAAPRQPPSPAHLPPPLSPLCTSPPCSPQTHTSPPSPPEGAVRGPASVLGPRLRVAGSPPFPPRL